MRKKGWLALILIGIFMLVIAGCSSNDRRILPGKKLVSLHLEPMKVFPQAMVEKSRRK